MARLAIDTRGTRLATVTHQKELWATVRDGNRVLGVMCVNALPSGAISVSYLVNGEKYARQVHMHWTCPCGKIATHGHFCKACSDNIPT